MSDYTTEGFIKTVKIAGSAVTFTIEPSEPYVFESRATNESAATRKILLVADDAQAKIVGADAEFSMGNKRTPKIDYTALLIAKANRMKVRLTMEEDKILPQEKRISAVKQLDVL